MLFDQVALAAGTNQLKVSEVPGCYFQTLCRWVLSVKKNYRPVSYHNWRHALNVCQTMFTVLRTGKMDRFMDDIEVSAKHTINTYLPTYILTSS